MSAQQFVWKSRIGTVLNENRTLSGKVFDIFLLGINLVACVTFVVRCYVGDHFPWLIYCETLILSFFAVEYGLRLWTAPKKLRYILSFYGIIDFVSILPLLYFVSSRFTFLGALKIFRILRFLRFLESEQFFFGALSRLHLQICRTFFTILTLLYVFSGAIFYAESHDPDRIINTFGESFYYCVSTLSTVGYGDFTPVTTAGRVLTVILIFSGVFLVPWQVGSLVRIMIHNESRKTPTTCARCGLKGHDPDAAYCKACGSVIYQEYEGHIEG
jgi:voltage-gated potassium channel